MPSPERSAMNDVRDAIAHVEAVLRRWDPIGVLPGGSDPNDAPLDEYDSYAPQVVALLQRGAGPDELEGYLSDVRTQEMGLPRVLSADRQIAEELASWWESRGER